MAEELSQSHWNIRELSVQELSELIVSLKVKAWECILNVAYKRVLSQDLGVIFFHLLWIEAHFLSLLLVFVRILWVFVVISIWLATHTDLEQCAAFIVGSWQSNCIF